jgi:hypothetical protein
MTPTTTQLLQTLTQINTLQQSLIQQVISLSTAPSDEALSIVQQALFQRGELLNQAFALTDQLLNQQAKIPTPCRDAFANLQESHLILGGALEGFQQALRVKITQTSQKQKGVAQYACQETIVDDSHLFYREQA